MGANWISMNSLNQIKVNVNGVFDAFLDTGYVESPEWYRVITDSYDRILGGIKSDGSIEWAIGVPTPVKEYIDSNISEIINGNEGISIDGLNKIIAFLEDFTTSDKLYSMLSNKADASLLNNKVDKETGKSLTSNDYTDADKELVYINEIVDSPEYIKVTVDSDGKILEGISQDGTKYLTGDLQVDGDIINDGIQESFDTVNDDIQNIKDAIETIEDTFSYFEPTTSPEYLSVVTDSSDNVISYRSLDGTITENVGIKTNNLTFTEQGMTDFQRSLLESGFNPQAPIDWSDKSYIHIPVKPTCAMVNITGVDSMPASKGVNWHAYIEVWDKNGNYFKKKVLLNALGNSSQAMEKHNFAVDFCEDDWVGDETTTIKIGNWVSQDSFHFKAYYTSFTKGECPIGYKIYEKMLATKPYEKTAPYMEYFVDMYNTNNSPCDDVEQNFEVSARCYPDSFPCIAYLNGAFYGIFSWQLKKHRDNFHMDRNAVDNIHLDGNLTREAIWNGTVEWTAFEVRNPKPKKSKWTLFCQDGTKYDGDAPKELMGTDSPEYDPTNVSHVKSAQTKESIIALSNYMSEIAVYENAYNSASAEDKPAALQTLRTEIEKRFSIEYLIDYVILMTITQDGDSIAKNWQWTTWGEIDGTMKWFPNPYDMDGIFGIDSTHSFMFGVPNNGLIGNGSAVPAKYPWLYYRTEIEARYKELRDANAISHHTIFTMIKEWVEAIGMDNFKLELKKWPDTPSQRPDTINSKWQFTGVSRVFYWDYVGYDWQSTLSYLVNDTVRYQNRLFKSLVSNNLGNTPVAFETTEYWDDITVKPGTYNAGDTVYDGYSSFRQFRVKAGETVVVTEDDEYADRPDHLVNAPFGKIYSTYPHEGGVFDSIYRISNWIKEKIRLIDIALNYNN